MSAVLTFMAATRVGSHHAEQCQCLTLTCIPKKRPTITLDNSYQPSVCFVVSTTWSACMPHNDEETSGCLPTGRAAMLDRHAKHASCISTRQMQLRASSPKSMTTCMPPTTVAAVSGFSSQTPSVDKEPTTLKDMYPGLCTNCYAQTTLLTLTPPMPNANPLCCCTHAAAGLQSAHPRTGGFTAADMPCGLHNWQ